MDLTREAAPDTLNGYPVVSKRYHPNCVTVMVEREPGDFAVATWWPELGDKWSWGHYDMGLVEARECMDEVAERNARR